MTIEAPVRAAATEAARSGRYRLSRAGILNVWQYDDQEFTFADGRMLLRGTNGAGKSKTLEMLLPFVLDGDRARMTSSARHHTSLLWLMTDGYDGNARVGYLWVEFARTTGSGVEETFTCGAGIRASGSARTATPWFFTTSLRVGSDLLLEDDAGPLSRQRLEERLEGSGQVFQQARPYKEHVGRSLFGLESGQYDEVLRLLYWLRQPQVGEDIEPKRLGEQLLQALPQLDEQAVRAAGETFDELAAFGDQLDRRAAAAEALSTLGAAYAGYARATVAARAAAVVSALKEEVRRTNALGRARRELDTSVAERDQVDQRRDELGAGLEQSRLRARQLEDSPEARDQRRLTELATRAGQLGDAAGAAETAAATADERHRRLAGRLARSTTEVVDRVQRFAGRVGDAGDGIREVKVPVTVVAPASLVGVRLGDAGDADQALSGLVVLEPGLESAVQATGRRQAAVRVVAEALREYDEARRASAQDERRAAEAEQRWEDAQATYRSAEGDAATAEESLWGRLRDWVADPAAPAYVLPGELTQGMLERLAESAAEVAAPVLAGLRGQEQAAALRRDRAAAELERLAQRRATIEGEVDPSPPEQALGRTPRPGGASLWRLVDFRTDVGDDDRAGIEAALQASGLLDAWVRPDGAVLDADQRDTVLPAGPATDGPSVLEVLRPDSPPDGGVSAEVVSEVLRRIAFAARGSGREAEPGATARVAADGSWSLGPLRGRAAKERAQYVGATARAEERRRRLAEVDAAIDVARTEHDDAEATAAGLGMRIADVERWRHAVPSPQALLGAWATVSAQAAVVERELASHEEAQAAVLVSRAEAARRRDAADGLARQHELPNDVDALAALRERLRTVEAGLAKLRDEVPVVRRDVERWRDDRAELDADAESRERVRTDARTARELADGVAAELDELRSAVGSTVRELEARLAELRDAMRAGKVAMDAAVVRSTALGEQIGGLRTAVGHAEDAVAEHADVRSAALRDLGAVVDVPGMLASAYAGRDQPDPALLVQAAGTLPGEAVPADARTLAREMAELDLAADVVDENAVWRAYSDAASGPAAEHEPAVREIGKLLAVTGRDDGGECAIGQLAERVTTSVERDRRLLTDRERQRFEQYILGELGDAIRGRRVEAEELVEAMNRLLADVTTSQGIRMRLQWRLRDDVPADAREAIGLLTQPVGALLPEERGTLRDALHRLIEASRAESPELSYGEHLAVALDYRRWFEFKIRYTRPESAGQWLELHRRSPLSQGEQKVLCYLPLFAAAAAHFTSLAGAAPHAPRLVLLDDAFPKIDVRTHPLLFGLLVQLDLDFVITSERLWGDHDTVPSLAIYEALRDPSQRGIAQFEYRWDGRALRAIG